MSCRGSTLQNGMSFILLGATVAKFLEIKTWVSAVKDEKAGFSLILKGKNKFTQSMPSTLRFDREGL